MSEVEVLDCLSNVPRFLAVECARLAFADGAKATVPRTDVPTQHERCRSIGPTFKDIRAVRFLADGVKIQSFDQLQHLILVCWIAQTDLQPGGLGLAGLLDIADYS